nr:MAG TPA: hypothetical protein [Caudoviricetes sp.]
MTTDGNRLASIRLSRGGFGREPNIWCCRRQTLSDAP